MSEFSETLLAISVIFMIFILPLWLILHYITRWKTAKRGLASEDVMRLADLERSATQMRERVQALEAILDEKSPDWRRQL